MYDNKSTSDKKSMILGQVRASFSKKVSFRMTCFLLLGSLVSIGCKTKQAPIPTQPKIKVERPTSQPLRRKVPAPPKVSQKSLKGEIDKLLEELPLEGASIGIVVSDRQGKILYKKNANKKFIPASNLKLVTLYTALQTLKPHYQFKTKFYSENKIDSSGLLKGNLYIRGSGDPHLRSEEIWRISKDLYNLGLRKVKGRLIFDDSYFDRNHFGDGWKDHDHQRYRPYLAGISALSLNYNTVTIVVRPNRRKGRPARIQLDPNSRYFKKIINKTKTVRKGKKYRIAFHLKGSKNHDTIVVKGTVPLNSSSRSYWRRVTYPSYYTAYSLARELRRQGIRVNQEPVRKTIPASAVEIYRHSSPYLSWLVQYAGKHSSNFVTEQLLKTMGAYKHGRPGSWKKGLQVTQSQLKSFGILPDDYVMKNGSGLGRQNRFSPMQFVTVLRKAIENFATRPEILISLPVAGQDGTLRKRMKKSPAAGLLRAKTGTIDGVSTLSGYVLNQKKKLLIFSICMNGKKKQGVDFRKLQNQIGIILAKSPLFEKSENEH